MPNQFVFYKENKTIDDITFPNVTVNWKKIVTLMLLELPDGEVEIVVRQPNKAIQADGTTSAKTTK